MVLSIGKNRNGGFAGEVPLTFNGTRMRFGGTGPMISSAARPILSLAELEQYDSDARWVVAMNGVPLSITLIELQWGMTRRSVFIPKRVCGSRFPVRGNRGSFVNIGIEADRSSQPEEDGSRSVPSRYTRWQRETT